MNNSNVLLDSLCGLILTLTIFFLLYTKYIDSSKKNARIVRMINKFPGPSALPFIGNLDSFMGANKTFQEVFSSLFKKYGPCYRFWYFNKPKVLISNSSIAGKILSSNDFTEKGEEYENLKEFIGHGLVTAKAVNWKVQRKLLIPAFHRKLREEFCRICNEQGDILIKILEAEDYSKPKFIFPRLSMCTMEIIFQSALGTQVGLQFESGKPFVDAMNILFEESQKRFFKPWLRIPIISFLFGKNTDLYWAINFLRDYLKSILLSKKAQRQNEISPKDEKIKPIIEVLLSHPNVFNDEDCVDELSTIFLAGSKTTADSINFTLFLLAVNQKHQMLVQDEITRVLQDSKEITLEHLNQMVYLEMCLKEAMRIYPAIPIISRKITSDLELDNGLILPQGSDAVILIYDIHHDPEIFPDPERFDPERFKSDVKRPPNSYIPFSAGIRNCIGLNFAMIEAKSTLAHILRKFEVSTDQKREEIKYILGISVECHPKIEFKLKPRLKVL